MLQAESRRPRLLNLKSRSIGGWVVACAATYHISFKYVQSMRRAGWLISKVKARRRKFSSFGGKLVLYWAVQF